MLVALPQAPHAKPTSPGCCPDSQAELGACCGQVQWRLRLYLVAQAEQVGQGPETPRANATCV